MESFEQLPPRTQRLSNYKSDYMMVRRIERGTPKESAAFVRSHMDAVTAKADELRSDPEYVNKLLKSEPFKKSMRELQQMISFGMLNPTLLSSSIHSKLDELAIPDAIEAVKADQINVKNASRYSKITAKNTAARGARKPVMNWLVGKNVSAAKGVPSAAAGPAMRPNLTRRLNNVTRVPEPSAPVKPAGAAGMARRSPSFRNRRLRK
jgi:hypothetical protein